MPRIIPLKSKEVKQIKEMIKQQWGFTKKLDYLFFLSKKDKLYIASRDILDADLSKTRINSIGVYFGEYRQDRKELRLTIEGSQMIGPSAKKNILELDDQEVIQWMKGKDIERDFNMQGFVIIKHNTDYLGCGKIKEEKKVLLNYVPKVRRVRLD